MEAASGFFTVDPSTIIIPEFRQRQAATPDEPLLVSIRERGQLQPIVVHSDMTLVAGERRLRACLQLDRPVLVRVFESLSPVERYEAELQENLARKQLTWQDETRAIAGYHQLRVDSFPGWTQMGTANALGLTQGHVSLVLTVAAELADEEILGCQSMKAAFNLISSRADRAKMAAISRGLMAADTVMNILPPMPAGATKEERTAIMLSHLKTDKISSETVEDIDKNLRAIQEGRQAAALLEANRKLEIASDLIINADFLEWATTYEGPKFDVLHIDFPYGKGYSGPRTRRTGKATTNPQYDDDPDIYFALVDGLLTLQDRFTFPAAHCIFWFDMQYYHWTIEQFMAAGWQLVTPFPYFWGKGYQGIASDVRRRPRHCYECALMFSRGDRKLVKLDRDYGEFPLDSEKFHLNQKPVPMLRHMLGMFVDEHTAVLDPTCGSGSAIAASKLLGASRVLGLELDADNADVAKLLLQRSLPSEVEPKPAESE